jgi:hypothetical protein
LKKERGTFVSETETQEQTTGEGDSSAAGQENGGSGARTALKVGALAAAAGTAAFAASKAMTSRGSEKSEESTGSGAEDGDSKSRALTSRVSTDQLISAIGHARWDLLKDLVVPFAESGAKSAGAFVAKEGPDLLSESLIPKFVEGFNEAQGQR